MGKESNVIDFEQKVDNRGGRPRGFKHAFFSVCVCVVVLGVFYFASPWSRFGVFFFDGINSVSRAEIVSLIGLDNDVLFLSINTSEIENVLIEHPAISEVRVSRSWINNLNVEIVEYEVVACADVSGDIFYVLSDGLFIHEDYGLQSGCEGRMIHSLEHEHIEDGVGSLFVRSLMQVDELVVNMIQLIEHEPKYGDANRFSLFLIDGNTIKVNSYTMVERLNLYPQR